MASIDKLQKLYQIQSLCRAERSLESAVAEERVTQAIHRTEQLIRQRAFLREERRNLRIYSEEVDHRNAALKCMRREDWVPESLRGSLIIATSKSGDSSSSFSSSSSGAAAAATTSERSSSLADSKVSGERRAGHSNEETVRINIGGLMFETAASVLRRDPTSLLAQLCPGESSTHPPILLPDSEGVFYFDRDWWLFRHLLQFLRDGSLPDDRPLLAQLYREAAFFHLSEMQKAIEEEKLQLRSSVGAQKNTKEGNKMWWRTLSSGEVLSGKANKGVAKTKEDWWLDSDYKGKTYLLLSSPAEKGVAGEKERHENENEQPSSTWHSSTSFSSVPDGYSRGTGFCPTPYKADQQYSNSSMDYTGNHSHPGQAPYSNRNPNRGYRNDAYIPTDRNAESDYRKNDAGGGDANSYYPPPREFRW